jgi:hypothetical protein
MMVVWSARTSGAPDLFHESKHLMEARISAPSAAQIGGCDL